MHKCLSCSRTENEVPLLVLEFHEATLHICPQCLPVLIHHPEKMEKKLEKAG